MQKWHLKQMCIRGGARQPKIPSWIATPKPFVISGFGPVLNNALPNHNQLKFLSHESWTAYHIDAQGGLEQAWYRYFMGCVSRDDPWSQCRCCLATFKDAEARILHNRKSQCLVYLTRAYKALKNFGTCLVCDADTKHSHWGVPLCVGELKGLDCNMMWRYLVLQPEGLRAALLELLEADPDAKILDAIR